MMKSLVFTLLILATQSGQAQVLFAPACSAADLNLEFVLRTPADPSLQKQLFLAKVDCYYLAVEQRMGGANVLFFSNAAMFRSIMSELKEARLKLGSGFEDQITAKALGEITQPSVLPPPPPTPQTFTLDQLRKGHMALLRGF